MSDNIDKLPVDDSLPDYKELVIVKEIFEKNREGVKQIVSSVKDSIFVFILFCIFSLPFVDTFIRKYIENQNTSFIIKVTLFTLIYFFVTNYYLIKK
jgi:hypothetical protein